MDRRRFLKAAGGTALAVTAGVPASGRQKPSQPDEVVVGEADERIRKCRMGTVALTMPGPEGQPLPAGVNLRISQTKHKFLFGCNIFKLGRCRTGRGQRRLMKSTSPSC